MARSPTSRRLDGHRRRSRSRDRRDDRERDHDRASDRRDRGRDDDRRERSRRDDDRRDVDRGGRDRERDRRDRERDGHDRHQGGRRDRDDDGYYSRRRDDGGRRHESRDRGHRSGYRERSRGPRRNTSRERSPVRDKQPRRGHRDDGLDNGNRERTTRRSYTPSDQNSRPPTANADRGDNGRKAPEPVLSREDREEQEKKKARVEAWAKKKKEMEEKKSVDASTSSTRADVPATSDPAAALDSPEPTQDEARPPSPGRTPFDPKAVKKRAEAKLKSMKNALGGDVAIPVSSNGVANGKRPTPGPRGLANGTVKQADAKIAAFDLSKTAGPQSADTTSKATTNLDDEDQVRRKFTKLPDLPQASEDDAAMANYDEDQDEGADDLHSDEEEAEAAREAAMKRAEEAQAEQQDVEMADAAAQPEAEQMEVDEEVDPLDAFMDTLDKAPPPPSRVPAKRNIREIQIFGEDDGPDLDAVGEDPDDILNNPKRKKKEIADVDHSKMDYEPIRKNFYSESLEIAEMTDEEIDALRFDMDNIKVNGKGAMRPITKWSHCGFSQQILEVINEHKFEKPTSIQSQALPAIMSGRDTIGVAKTGSGKTLAFVLPMFRHIKDQRPVTNLEGPIGLILAPTRELAVQIHRECKPYLKALNIRGACAYGGAPIKDQIADLKRGAEVVVCTPGRLIDLLAANAGRVMNLKRVSYVVMDEADRMLDMGFEPQITKLLGNIRPDRQLVAFSATFPKKMEFLAKKALKDPISIQVGERSVVAAEITQIIEIREEDTKFHRILQLIGDLYENDEDARTLIFVERQEMADSIFKHLCKMGYPTVAVHGAREQIDRDDAINNFRNGAIPIMVATSVAARGLDVQQLKLVINYDSPNHGEDYVHRAGRTGRAGNTGTAVTFVTPEQERFAPFLVRALQDSKQEVPDKLKEMAESFKKKVDAGQAQKAGSGFGGHGIEKMEAARAAERVRLKGQFKTDDEPEEDDKDKEEKSKKEKAIEELVGKAAGAVKGRDAAPEKPAESSAAGQPLMDSDLEKHLTNALKVQKVEKMAAAPAADDPLARVAAVAATISSRIGANKGSTRPGAPADNRGPDAGAFHATLEINDFPQMARWGVTNRTNVAKILESTGTSITTKGTYYPPGKAPEEGELPKLYILVEGDTEVAVSQAMAELTRHLREGMAKSQEADARGGAGGPGRYKVLS